MQVGVVLPLELEMTMNHLSVSLVSPVVVVVDCFFPGHSDRRLRNQECCDKVDERFQMFPMRICLKTHRM